MPVLVLGDDPADVPQARHWVLSRCVEGGLAEDARFAVELVTSELVANAYQHGRPPVSVAVERAEAVAAVEGALRLVIGVTDSGPGSPVVKEFDDEALGGRGMALVESLTAEWGVAPDPAGPGKTVWCRLAG
ncbi:ATP-binding protein [uncultured Pseudokineococcus sp.]|uniref:ATP-binding protein n=1 Tax=uncultured Pseudokineococcus sp. TaxID=1642928 RepID=UPI0026177D87|nr:ATP-binding protein [uncultured Pseudokineococcus sp.]